MERGALLVLEEQAPALTNLVGSAHSPHFETSADPVDLLRRLESGGAREVLLDLRFENTAVLDCLALLQSQHEPLLVHLLANQEPRLEGWPLPAWLSLHVDSDETPALIERLSGTEAGPTKPVTNLRVVDYLSLVDAGRLSLQLRLCLEQGGELEVVCHEGAIWTALRGDSLGSDVLSSSFAERVASVLSRQQSGPVGQRWVFESLREIALRHESKSRLGIASGSAGNVVSIARKARNRAEALELWPEDINDSNSKDTHVDSTKQERERRIMANINETLAAAMDIEGARAAALADYESGMCLGALGGTASFNVEVAAAGNAEVVRSKLKVMNQLGLTDEIEDILISLGKEYHLILPIAGSRLFLYLAFNRSNANLALARHKARALASELSV